MIIIISPAKNLDFSTNYPDFIKPTIPIFESQADYLVSLLQKLDKREIAKLMSLADKLVELNQMRFQDFAFKSPPLAKSRPAIFTYNGDVYKHLDAKTLTKPDLEFAQKHLFIISGLYGLLNSFDLIQAYRLEMGTKLTNNAGPDLYSFWHDLITNQLNDLINENQILINLCSKEYSSVIDQTKFNGQIINLAFKDRVKDQLKIVGINSKKARGAAARLIITHKIVQPELIKNFPILGYKYSFEHSTKDEYVFIK